MRKNLKTQFLEQLSFLLIFNYFKFIKRNEFMLKINDYANQIVSLLPVDSVGHNVVEIVSSNESIIVQISLGEVVLDFFVGEVFS